MDFFFFFFLVGLDSGDETASVLSTVVAMLGILSKCIKKTRLGDLVRLSQHGLDLQLLVAVVER
jgi:hypothetical protein